MFRTKSVVPKLVLATALLVGVLGLAGCSKQASDGGADGTARTAGAARSELVVGFLPVT